MMPKDNKHSAAAASGGRTLAKRVLLAGVGGVALMVAGCAQSPLVPEMPGVNPDYHAGSLNLPNTPVPNLEEVINRVPDRKDDDKDAKEDRLRNSAMHDAAVSYGARAGLAWETRNINKAVEAHAPETSRVYDFQRLLIKGPDHVMILPPVISEAKKAWEAQDAGKSLRVADTVYEIIDQARFTAVPPAWQSYIVRDYKSPEGPPDGLLPQDGSERDKWVKWVTEGWAAGRKQAQDIFKADLDRLERDFSGMVRYRALLGTTGTGQDMRVNDRAVRITRDPTLNVAAPNDWHASATTPTPDGAGTTNPTAGDGDPVLKPATADKPVKEKAKARPKTAHGADAWTAPKRDEVF
jgi:defect-in-organelle-trafficking protein DotC